MSIMMGTGPTDAPGVLFSKDEALQTLSKVRIPGVGTTTPIQGRKVAVGALRMSARDRVAAGRGIGSVEADMLPGGKIEDVRRRTATSGRT